MSSDVKNKYHSDEYKELCAHSDYIGNSNYYNGSEDCPDTQIWVLSDDSIDELIDKLLSARKPSPDVERAIGEIDDILNFLKGSPLYDEEDAIHPLFEITLSKIKIMLEGK